MENFITIQNVTKNYKNQLVLTHIDLNFKRNLIYGIIGRNGTGKSVLLKLITGLLKPNEGKIVVDGKTIGVDLDFPLNTGILFDYDFLPNYTAFENLKLIAHINKKVTDFEIYQILELVQLSKVEK